MIASVLIPLIGAGGAGLILVLGFLWRARFVLAACILALLMTIYWSLLPQDRDGWGETEAARVPPTMQLLSWGQQDALHINDVTGATSPNHVVYATVAITAGDMALSVPSIFEENLRHRVWLTVAGEDRTSDEIRRATALDGTPLTLLPSHNDELVRHVEGQRQVLPVPGPECAALQPGERCEVTLSWWLSDTGPVAGIYGLTLVPYGIDPSDPASPTAETAHLQWPDLPAESVCSGVMSQWCY